ncbi:MAG: hypothetical protein Q9176_000940 [Flavoplaca citrina]
MSNDQGRSLSGEQYHRAPSYSQNHIGIYGADTSQYYNSQLSQLQRHAFSTLQHDHSANSYAFNANSFLLPSHSHPESNVAPSWAHGNKQPGTYSASSSNPPKLFPPYDTLSSFQGLPATAPSEKPISNLQDSPGKPKSNYILAGMNGNHVTTQDLHSDMEDGELSEGADPGSSGAHSSNDRKSINLLSRDLEDTADSKIMEHNKVGHHATDLDQRSQVRTTTINGVFQHSPQTRLTNRGDSQTNRDQKEKSLHASHNGARHAVAQLQRHNIGYAQLLEEQIHPDLLKSLYSETPKQTKEATLSSKSLMQATLPHPLPRKLPEHTFNQRTDVPTRVLMPEVAKTDSSNNAKMMRLPEPPQLARPDMENTSTQAPTSSDRTLLQKIPEYQRSPEVATGPPGTSKADDLQRNDASSCKTPNDVPSSREKLSVPDVVERKSPATPATAPKSLPPSASQPAVKPPIPKATTKPVDRKDYIARLQAAKAGKVASTATASQLSLGSTTPKAPQNAAPNVTSQLRVASPSVNISSQNGVLTQNRGSTNSSVTAVSFATPTVESKKREQTELARRKIEELKSRSNVPKEKQSTNDELSSPAASSKQQTNPTMQSVEVRPNEVSTKTASSGIALSAPQHAYFPFRNGPFSLPGLFMSTSSVLDDHKTEAPKAAPLQDRTQNGRESEPTVTHSLVATSSLPLPFSAPENSPPSPQDAESPEEISRVTPVQINSNPRKRPTAADFIQPIPSKIQRSHSYKADNSVVFEVSDDDADEFEIETSDVETSGDPEIKVLHSRHTLASHLASPDDPKSRPESALNDPHAKPEKAVNRLNVAQSNPQNPNKKDADGLRAREEEIERMNRKIIEMEQRRKMRQDVSRTQTPGTPGRRAPSLKPTESNSNIHTTSDGTKRLDEPPFQATPPAHELEDARNGGTAAAKLMSVDLQGATPRQIGDVQPLAESLGIVSVKTDEQQLQRRTTEIKSSLSSADAALEDLRARLEILRRDAVELQTQIQEQIDSKRGLEEELAKILEASSSVPASSARDDDDIVKPQQGCDGQQLDMSPNEAQEEGQSPDVEAANILDEPLGDRDVNRTSNTGPMSETALSIGVRSNQSLVSGELAEDVMDISGSEDEGEVTGNVPVFSNDAEQLVAKSDSEEPYEPPSSFGGTEDAPNRVTDSSKQQQSLTNESLRQHDNSEADQTPPAINNSAAVDAYVAAEDELHNVPQPGRSQSPSDSSNSDDSDDYEPPEPMASVDLASLTSNTAGAAAEASFPPRDANQDLQACLPSSDALPAVIDQVNLERETSTQSAPEQAQLSPGNDKHGHFVPYESPLQQFHAYRYHPDFVSTIGNGYRSLTYSHKIDASTPIYDMILVHMGSIPEGLSEEQRSAFVVGLRQTIQEIRVRKVKDFKTVASEIAAYRARFLGDSSKILPL